MGYRLLVFFPTDSIFWGASDLTALVNSIYVKTGLIAFHGPMGVSNNWDQITGALVILFAPLVMHAAGKTAQQVLFGEMVTLQNPPDYLPVSETMRPGVAEGVLLGGNLVVFTRLLGLDLPLLSFPSQRSVRNRVSASKGVVVQRHSRVRYGDFGARGGG